MIDRAWIGHRFEPVTVDVERGRLRLFAKAIGEEQALYRDTAAARAAGFDDVPLSPTLLFCLEMDRDDPFDFLRELGIDLARILHAEQSFSYYAPVTAGEQVTYVTRVGDIYDKKGGALEFLALDTEVRRSDTTLVAEMRRLVVVKNG